MYRNPIQQIEMLFKHVFLLFLTEVKGSFSEQKLIKYSHMSEQWIKEVIINASLSFWPHSTTD